tara:strand:- start:33342 stop:33473 length:132 start_codon:yes stop_codon:yes gene_type:complete
VNDVTTVEELENENLNLYEALGECSVDKKEIQDVVTRINKESD